jgi:hypothetical protein
MLQSTCCSFNICDLLRQTTRATTSFPSHLQPCLVGTQVGTFTTPLKDGWGLTTDGSLLVASDGSDQLYWLDPANNFKIVKQTRVLDGTKPVYALNEVNTTIWG